MGSNVSGHRILPVLVHVYVPASRNNRCIGSRCLIGGLWSGRVSRPLRVSLSNWLDEPKSTTASTGRRKA